MQVDEIQEWLVNTVSVSQKISVFYRNGFQWAIFCLFTIWKCNTFTLYFHTMVAEWIIPTNMPTSRRNTSIVWKQKCIMEATSMSNSTEHHGQMVRTPASYLRSPRFKSQPWDQLFWLRFFGFPLSPSRQMLVWYLKSGHNCFLTYPFPFINYSIIWCYTIWGIESVEDKP